MAMCVIAVLEVAPCQCFSPGGHHTTSPGRISSFGPPSLCTQPHPYVTIRVCPSGCRCHAVRAPGSNVTLTARTRAGAGAWPNGSMRTLPVKYSSGPLPEGCEPLLLSSISEFLNLIGAQLKLRLGLGDERVCSFGHGLKFNDHAIENRWYTLSHLIAPT